MNARPRIVAVAVVALIIVSGWLLLRRRGAASRPENVTAAVAVAQDATPQREKGESRTRAVEDMKRKPMTFWGRVVDQTGMPVRDSIVTGNTPVSTDQDGFFQVQGFHSLHIGITGVSKVGYYLPPLFTATNFYLSEQLKQGLDRANPVVIHALRKEG